MSILEQEISKEEFNKLINQLSVLPNLQKLFLKKQLRNRGQSQAMLKQ